MHSEIIENIISESQYVINYIPEYCRKNIRIAIFLSKFNHVSLISLA